MKNKTFLDKAADTALFFGQCGIIGMAVFVATKMLLCLIDDTEN